MEDKKNPFFEGVKRVGMMPLRALQLPFQVAGELAGMLPGSAAQDAINSGNRADATQRMLAGEVTGQQPEYSEGRKWANRLSLGLVPRNPSAQVDPSKLTPDGRERFHEMNPLQQALLQAKNPRDFADLIARDDFFAEQGNTVLKANEMIVNPQGEEVISNRPQTTVVPQGSSIANTKTGEEVYANRPGFVEAIKPSDLLGAYTPESIEKFLKSHNVADLVADRAALDNALEVQRLKNLKPSGKGGADDKPRRLSLNTFVSGYNTQVKPYNELAMRLRNFVGVFGQDPDTLPMDIREDLTRMKVNVGSIKPTAIRDVAMIVGFLKAIDPESVARESEQAMIKAARQYGLPGELISNMLHGEVLTNVQRADLFRTMRDSFTGQIQGYESVREGYQAMADKDEIDPEYMPDYMADVRPFFESQSVDEFLTGAGASPEAQQDFGTQPQGGDPSVPPAAAQRAPSQPMPSAASVDGMYQQYLGQGGAPNDEQAFRDYYQKLTGASLP